MKTTLKKDSNPKVKLDKEQKEEIRQLYRTGFFTEKELAMEFAVNQSTISNIITKIR